MMFPVEEQAGVLVVRLSGEVDLSKSPTARKVILNSLRKQRSVMVDLSAVDYIDSAGIASLVEGLQYARSHDLAFGLVGTSEAAMKVLCLARLDTVFNIYATLDDWPGDGD